MTRYTIYYHPVDDFEGNEEGIQWLALIPSLPTSAQGSTKEEALSRVLFHAHETIAFKLKEGLLTAEEAMACEFTISPERRSIEDLAEEGKAAIERVT